MTSDLELRLDLLMKGQMELLAIMTIILRALSDLDPQTFSNIMAVLAGMEAEDPKGYLIAELLEQFGHRQRSPDAPQPSLRLVTPPDPAPSSPNDPPAAP